MANRTSCVVIYGYAVMAQKTQETPDALHPAFHGISRKAAVSEGRLSFSSKSVMALHLKRIGPFEFSLASSLSAFAVKVPDLFQKLIEILDNAPMND